MSDTEELRIKVTQKIDEVEQAVQSLQILRKTLLQKAYETKQSILSAFINERDSMQCKEVRLLGEVDSLHHSKDDAVVIQLTKLNQVLGCLRNCLQSEHPCGDCLEKYEDLDMIPATDISLEFTTASEQLRQSVCNSNNAQYSSQSHYLHVTGSNMEGLEDVMQWLVTPTNVDRHHHTPEIVDSCVHSSQASRDSHVTEWLLEYHGNNHPSARTTATPSAEMGSIFAGVKLDDSENWLRSDSYYRQDELCAQTPDQQFEDVTTQACRDWLIQNDKARSISDASESDGSVSSAVSSSSTSTASSSSASSSYVVLPLPSSGGSAITSCSAMPTSYWLSRSPNQSTTSPPAESNPSVVVEQSADSSNVSEWLSRCNSPRQTSVQRSRLVSVSSLASDVSTRTDAESLHDWSLNSNKDWLINTRPAAVSEVNTTSNKFDRWLQNESTHNSQTVSSQTVRAQFDDWLTAESRKQSPVKYDTQEDYGMQTEEKHDVVAEKSETSYWLKKNSDNLDEMWLLKKKSAMGGTQAFSRTTCLHKDWLMTVNRMTQISRSENSGWLIGSATC